MMKAIIFDMGGVLIDLDLEASKQSFKCDLGYQNVDQMIDACHQKGLWGEMEEGKISAEEFRQAILADSRPGSTFKDVDTAVSKILVGIAPQKIRLLKRLAEDYDLYMLSNNNSIATARAKEIFAEVGIDMYSDFRKCFLSYQMKMLKPSKDFYKAVIDDIGIPSDQMLFIDDSIKNVEGALAAGLPAVYYEPGTDLAALLAEVLGRPELNIQGGEEC